MSHLAILATAFVLSLCFSGLVLLAFPKMGLMDRPELYGHKRSPIPYPAGVAPVLAIMLGLLIFSDLNANILALLSGASLLAITCFIDDRRGLSPLLRLGVQIISALILVLGGIGIMSVSSPFGGAIPLDQWTMNFNLANWTFTLTLLADLIAIVWIVVMINAFNWIDGVSGISSGVSAVASFVLLLLSLRPDFHYVDQSLAITLSSLLLGASIAFMIFDFPKPKILMGDTGSMLLGFFLAVTAIISGGKIATTLLILGFPILDFIWVISRRILKKQSPFKGDLLHFHHRFLRAGFSEKQIVLFFMGSSALFGICALLLQTTGKFYAFAGIFVLMILLIGFLFKKM